MAIVLRQLDRDELRKLCAEYVEMDDAVKRATACLREMRNRRAALNERLLQFMKDNHIGELDMSRYDMGALRRQRRNGPVKPSASEIRKRVTQVCPPDVVELVFANVGQRVVDSLKRVTLRR